MTEKDVELIAKQHENKQNEQEDGKVSVKTKNRKKELIISLVAVLVFIAVVVVFFCCMMSTNGIKGRTLTVDSVGDEYGAYRTYVQFENGNTARFSSDIGNAVKYVKFGNTVYFGEVVFQGKQTKNLKATISHAYKSYKDDEDCQYFFMDFYDGNKPVGVTYPSDTIRSQKSIINKSFSATEFGIIDEEAPSFMPDAHETPAELSEIDQIAVNFFRNVKNLEFTDDHNVVATLKNDKILTGTYTQFLGTHIYLNFGENYTKDGKYIQMKVFDGYYPYPTSLGGFASDSPVSYDPDYSNLTPPPYYKSGTITMYWDVQGSTNIWVR